MTTRPSAVVAGWIGSTNLGDELIASVMFQRLSDRGFDVVAPSVDPPATVAQFGVAAIPHRDMSANRKAISGAAGLVFGGGSLIQDMTSQLSLPYHLSRPWHAQRNGVPVVGVGLDAGPLQTRWGRRITKSALRKAEVIGVRNEESAGLLREVGLTDIEVTADLAVAHPTPEVVVADEIAVSLRPPVYGGIRPVAGKTGLQDDGWLDAAAAALDETADRTGLGIRFVAFQTDRDRLVHEAVADRMTAAHHHTEPTLGNIVELVSAARVVVAMRYHGGIAALVGGRPAVLLGYASKVDALANQVGEGFVGLGVDERSLATIPDAVEEALGKDDRVAQARSRLREAEHGNERLLDRLVR